MYLIPFFVIQGKIILLQTEHTTSKS